MATSYRETLCGRLDRGARPETGGLSSPQQRAPPKMRKPGTAKNGISHSPMVMAAALRSTGFIAMRAQDSGLLMPAMTDTLYVHRTPLPLGLQLSRRGLRPRGVGGRLPFPSNAGDGAARSGWRLWRRAFSSGHEEARTAGAYRGGDHFPAASCDAVGKLRASPCISAVRFA